MPFFPRPLPFPSLSLIIVLPVPTAFLKIFLYLDVVSGLLYLCVFVGRETIVGGREKGEGDVGC